MIIDDSNKLKGQYRVKNESYSEFDAFSQITTYNKNNRVYVQIPKGDFNNTKFIVGKKEDKDQDKPYNYVNPFNTFVDLTGNMFIAGQNNKPLWSILANGDESEIMITPEEGIIFTDENQGYTRLGLRGSFRAWLEELGVKSGSYGLKITINGSVDTTVSETSNQDYNIYLDTSDMYGNPYNFEGYYQQEIVIDVSSLAKINSIKIYLYQRNNFKDKDGNIITYDWFNDENNKLSKGWNNKPFNNIYVKDIYMSLGIALDEIQNEFIRLYSLDGSTYVIDKSGQVNSKILHLKWVHFDSEGNKQEIKEIPEGCKINWYYYDFGAPSADIYSGVYWQYIKNAQDLFEITYTPRSNKSDERIKVIIQYNGKIYRSNVVTFRNEKEVPNDATLDALNALSIKCEDNTNGNYLIYNQANYILNSIDSKTERKAVLHFNSKTYAIDKDFVENDVLLIDAQKVTWLLPVKSMINFTVDDSWLITEDGNYYIYEKENPSVEDFSFTYTIGSFYSAHKSNNTLIAKVLKDNIEYTATKIFTFGQAGTNGTDCTLVIDLIKDTTKGKPCVALLSGKRNGYIFKAQLYDNQGKEINLSEKSVNFTWKFLDNARFSGINLQDNTQQECILNVTTTNSIIENLIILEVTLSGWGDYNLTAYLPIPITTIENGYITGTTQVIYLSNGDPVFSKEAYHLYDSITEKQSDWTIKSNGSSNYIGELKQSEKTKEYFLYPLAFFVKEAPLYGVQASVDSSIVWTQPILVIQNKYPSAMVNKWNGKTLEIDKTNGTILSTMIAAGKKEENNTFSGVLMGDCSPSGSDDSLRTTGLYGFRQGKQSFAFKEDGTAFIGESGFGRINFDGTKGEIKSSSYDTDTRTGLLINLKDNYISSYNNKRETIRIDGGSNSSYFKVSTLDGTKTLINIGDKNYYLMSKNYDSSSDKGTYINLDNGEITAKNGTFSGNIYINYNGTNHYWEGTSTKRSLTSILDDLGGNIKLLNQQINRINTNVANITRNQNSVTDMSAYLSLGIGDNGHIQDGNAVVLSVPGTSGSVRTSNLGASLNCGNGSLTVSSSSCSLSNVSMKIWLDLDVDGTIYGTVSGSGSSDQRLKTNINYSLDKYRQFFNDLKPVSFKYKNSEENNSQLLGFIAQDIQQNILNNNLQNSGIIGTFKQNGEEYLNVNYYSIIALNTYMLQQAYKEIEELKLQVKELKEEKTNE